MGDAELGIARLWSSVRNWIFISKGRDIMIKSRLLAVMILTLILTGNKETDFEYFESLFK